MLLVSLLFVAVINPYSFQIQNFCFKYYSLIVLKHMQLPIIIIIALVVMITLYLRLYIIIFIVIAFIP